MTEVVRSGDRLEHYVSGPTGRLYVCLGQRPRYLAKVIVKPQRGGTNQVSLRYGRPFGLLIFFESVPGALPQADIGPARWA